MCCVYLLHYVSFWMVFQAVGCKVIPQRCDHLCVHSDRKQSVDKLEMWYPGSFPFRCEGFLHSSMCGENLGYRKLSLECVRLNILLTNFPVRNYKIAKGGKITMTFAREEGCKFPAWKSAFLSLESRIEAK